MGRGVTAFLTLAYLTCATVPLEARGLGLPDRDTRARDRRDGDERDQELAHPVFSCFRLI